MVKDFNGRLDELNIKMQTTKDGLLRPVLFCLRRLGITANMLSTLKALGGVVAMGLVTKNVYAAAIIFLAVYFFDVFDGSLARYAKEDSDRGKFIDVLTDQAVYALVVLSLIRLDFLSIKALAYNLLAVPVLYLLVIIQRNENKPTDWIIRPVAKLNYYKTPFCVAALGVIFGFWGRGVASWMLYAINILATGHIIYAYWKIVRREKPL